VAKTQFLYIWTLKVAIFNRSHFADFFRAIVQLQPAIKLPWGHVSCLKNVELYCFICVYVYGIQTNKQTDSQEKYYILMFCWSCIILSQGFNIFWLHPPPRRSLYSGHQFITKICQGCLNISIYFPAVEYL